MFLNYISIGAVLAGCLLSYHLTMTLTSREAVNRLVIPVFFLMNLQIFVGSFVRTFSVRVVVEGLLDSGDGQHENEHILQSRDRLSETFEIWDGRRASPTTFPPLSSLRNLCNLGILPKGLLDNVRMLFEMCLATYSKLKALNARHFHTPSWRPVILEDLNGGTLPLPMGSIQSWEALDAILAQIPRLSSEESRVIGGQYVRKDAFTDQEIDRSSPLMESLRPGQQVFVRLVLNHLSSRQSSVDSRLSWVTLSTGYEELSGEAIKDPLSEPGLADGDEQEFPRLRLIAYE